MLPGIGQAIGLGISTIGSIGSAATRIKTAKEQAKKAEELRKKRIKAQPIQQEYKDVANMNQMMALSNMPGLETAKSGLDNSEANSARTIRESGKTGSDRLSAIASLGVGKMKTLADLDVKNAGFRVKRQDVANRSQEGIGALKDDRRQEARLEEEKLREQADALEIASTANSQNAIDDITSTIGSTASTLAGIEGGGKKKSKDESVSPKINSDLSTTKSDLQKKQDESNSMGIDTSNIDTPNLSNMAELNPYKAKNTDFSKLDSKSISEVQKRLKDAGLYDGIIDGVYGPTMKKAISKIK